MRRITSFLTGVFLCVLLLPPIARSEVILDFTGGGGFVVNVDATLGYSFTVNSGPGIVVDGLGVYDPQNNGLGRPHDVGLWKSDGTLLSSTTVNNASNIEPSSSAGQWLVEPVSAVYLEPGNYHIGVEYTASDGTDFFVAQAVSSSIPDVSFNNNLFAVGTGLNFPAGNLGGFDDGFFGPTFTGAVAPEPASVAIWSLLGLGLAGFGYYRMRRKK